MPQSHSRSRGGGTWLAEYKEKTMDCIYDSSDEFADEAPPHATTGIYPEVRCGEFPYYIVVQTSSNHQSENTLTLQESFVNVAEPETLEAS